MITFEIVGFGKTRKDKEAISVYKEGKFLYVYEENLEIKTRGRKQIAGAKSFIESLKYTGVSHEKIEGVMRELDTLAEEVYQLEEETIQNMFLELEKAAKENGAICICYLRKETSESGNRWVKKKVEEKTIELKELPLEQVELVVNSSSKEANVYIQEISPGILEKYCEMNKGTIGFLNRLRQEKYCIDMERVNRKKTLVYLAGEKHALSIGQRDGVLTYEFGSYVEAVREEEEAYRLALYRLYEKVKKAARLKQLYEQDYYFFNKAVNLERKSRECLKNVLTKHMSYQEIEETSAMIYHEKGKLETFQGGSLTGKFFEFGEWMGYISWENENIVIDKTFEGLNQKIAKMRENEIEDVFKNRKEQVKKKETKEEKGYEMKIEEIDRILNRAYSLYNK